MVSAVILFMRSFLRFKLSTVKCNDSVSFSFLFSFFFVKDQIASFQLKQIVQSYVLNAVGSLNVK